MSSPDTDLDFKDHVTVLKGLRTGFRMAVMTWNRRDERYEPSYSKELTTKDRAEAQAKEWASRTGIEYRP